MEKLECGHNEVFTVCECRKAVTMTDIAMQAMYKEKLQIMDGASHFNTDSPPPFCATFAEVEVDTETGQVKVLHLATAVDPGAAVNPMQAEGQVEGAVTQGMGYALTEELLLDGAGRPLNPNFTRLQDFLGEGYAEADDDPGGDRRTARAVRRQVDFGSADQRAGAGYRQRHLTTRLACAFASCRYGRKTCCGLSATKSGSTWKKGSQNEYSGDWNQPRRAPGGTGASLRSRTWCDSCET